MFRLIGVWVLCGLLAGCTTVPTAEQRKLQIHRLLAENAWVDGVLKSGPFELAAFWPRSQTSADRLTVYIEGDGLAWTTASMPSADPTPLNPLALKLAMAQPSGNVVYISRPCQYIGAEQVGCSQRYWTHARFAPEVIEATNLALDQIKKKFDAQTLVLVGYSGGGAVASLLGARRTDVIRLITVAGNLDHKAWTDLHHISPLTGSLNPVDSVESLREVLQIHFVGGEDHVVPAHVAQGFVKRQQRPLKAKVQVVQGFDHHCCWVRDWPKLWQQHVNESVLLISSLGSKQKVRTFGSKNW